MPENEIEKKMKQLEMRVALVQVIVIRIIIPKWE